MASPKIIFVNRVYWPSGAATAQLLTDLAEALAARGWPVHVVTAGTEPGPRHGVTIHRTGAGDRHGGLASRAVNYVRFLLAARRSIGRLAAPGDIVVLKTDPPLLAAAVTSAAVRREARVIHWVQDVYPEIVPQHVGAWAAWPLAPLRWARNRAWRQASRCLAVGEDMQPTVQQAGVPDEKISVFPNWAPRELAVPADPAAVAALRAAWGVQGRFVAVYSGNLGRVHEFAAILHAADILRGESDIQFLFIGEGARYREVRAAAAAAHLPNVRFLPPQPRTQLAATLAAADVHFVTLRPGYERLVNPSKLAGALAAGRPVLFVGPPQCANAALLAREDCGLAFAPADGAGLAAALRHLHSHPALAGQSGRSARACYERHYTFEAAVLNWEEMLRGLASSAQSPVRTS